MRIGIDARFVGPRGTGIGKYTQKLIENLGLIDTKNEYSIFLRKENWHYLKLENKNFKKILADVTWYSLEEQIKMPAIFKNQNLDILHIPHFNVPLFYNNKFVVTIHDLIHLDFPETSTTTKNVIAFKTKRFGFKKILNNAINKSSRIITPSNFVKGEIVGNFKVDSSKIHVTCEAAEEEYFKVATNYPSRLGRPEADQLPPTNSILYVGNAYPHKNLLTLLDAFKIITTNYKLQTTNLTLVCPRDVFRQRLNQEIKIRSLEKYVDLLEYQETKKLVELFSKASAYVSPSLSEGFGIPGLNAMAAKIPVIASDIPTFKEIYSNAALYFDPSDQNDIAKKIYKILRSESYREKLIQQGNLQVKKYSWQKMARKTLNIYENSLSKR